MGCGLRFPTSNKPPGDNPAEPQTTLGGAMLLLMTSFSTFYDLKITINIIYSISQCPEQLPYFFISPICWYKVLYILSISEVDNVMSWLSSALITFSFFLIFVIIHKNHDVLSVKV